MTFNKFLKAVLINVIVILMIAGKIGYSRSLWNKRIFQKMVLIWQYLSLTSPCLCQDLAKTRHSRVAVFVWYSSMSYPDSFHMLFISLLKTNTRLEINITWQCGEIWRTYSRVGRNYKGKTEKIFSAPLSE